MKTLFYSTRSYDKISFRERLAHFPEVDVEFIESPLNINTVELAAGYDAICIFVNDNASTKVVQRLHELGVKHIALRCAGYNNVDYETANELGMLVTRVPAYSPESVAEHALALLMSINRRIHQAYTRLKLDNNFDLTGLSGFCLCGKTAGIIGYGRIGQCFGKICRGLGMEVIAYDPYYKGNDVELVTLDELYSRSDVISLHTLYNEQTHHMINKEAIDKMKQDVILINVARGGLIDTKALIEGLKAGKFFGVGLDVFEGEENLAFINHENNILMKANTQDLLAFRNVIITSHQAFLTDVALYEIAHHVLNALMNNDPLKKYEVK